MNLKSLMLLTTGATIAATGAMADGHMAGSMTLVSWGGAYQASQTNAYSDPYAAANDGLEIIWD